MEQPSSLLSVSIRVGKHAPNVLVLEDPHCGPKVSRDFRTLQVTGELPWQVG
jgi:hypothetical protein